MTITWMLEKNIFDEECHNKLKQSIINNKDELVEVVYTPFGGRLDKDSDKWNGSVDQAISKLSDHTNPVVFYGSLNCARTVNRYPVYPGTWLNEEIFKFGYYQKFFNEFSLNNNFLVTPLWYVDVIFDLACRMFGSDSVFIRPDDNMKSFTGQVVSQKNKLGFCVDLQDRLNLDINHPCIICPTRKDISGEFRFIVVENKVITGSKYQDGTGNIEDAQIFANKVLENIEFELPNYSLDICYLKDSNEYKVIEIGSVNCSGLYNCDTDAFVKHIGLSAYLSLF